MGNGIQKNLAQRAKDLLQTDEEHSLFELAELLRQYRNETHPDKFQGQELKTKAEARFKDAQSLLEELEKQLEIDRFNRNRANWLFTSHSTMWCSFRANWTKPRRSLRTQNTN